jgi:hypothetical protein
MRNSDIYERAAGVGLTSGLILIAVLGGPWMALAAVLCLVTFVGAIAFLLWAFSK